MNARMGSRGTVKVLVLGLTIIVATAARAQDAKPAKDGPKTGPSIAAVIKSVEPAKSLLTVILARKGEKGAQPAVEHYELPKDTKVFLQVNKTKGPQPEGKLADLTEGTPVILQVSPDELTVLSITVCGRSLNATVKSVDADERTITVVSKGSGGAVEATYDVAEDAQIVVPDPKVKGSKEQRQLADLSEGTPVTLQLSAKDAKMVTGITVSGRTIHAVVQSADAAAGTVTIKSGDKEQTLLVAADAKIVIRQDGSESEGKPADLVGQKVSLSLSASDQKTVTAARLDKSTAPAKGGK